MTYSEPISAFLSFLRNCEMEYNIAGETLDSTNSQTQDILHKLELDAELLKYHDKAKLALILTQVRIARRQAKDTRALLEPVMSWIATNTKFIKEMERLLGEVRKIEKSVESRYYNPRTEIVAKTLRGDDT